MSYLIIENFEQGVEKLKNLPPTSTIKVLVSFETTRLMGPPVVLALFELLQKEFSKKNLSFYMDCGSMPGLVLAALRGGDKILSGIQFKKSSKTYAQIKSLCGSAGVKLI